MTNDQPRTGDTTPVPSTSPAHTPSASRREFHSVAALLAAEVLALTVLLAPVGLFVWGAGLVILARSRRWAPTQKRLAALVLGTGYPLAVLVVVLGSHLSSRDCVGGSGGIRGCADAGGGMPVWAPLALALAAIAYGAAQVIVARRLLAAVGEHGARPRGVRLR